MSFRPVVRPVARAVARAVNSKTGFSPLELFANGEQGVWYDPSDLSTLYQDAEGTAPVTADGDPVGLMLDKSQGLELGENIANPGPIVGGLIGEGDTFHVIGSAVVGKWYYVTLTISGYSGSLDVGFPRGSLDAFQHLSTSVIRRSSNGTISFIGKAVETQLRLSDRDSNTCTYNDISVRELKGNHATQSVAASRPTYRTDGNLHWLFDDKVDDVMTATLPAMPTATVARATDDGVTIDYPVNIPAGSYNIDNNSTQGFEYGRIIVDRQLTAPEQAALTEYLEGKS